MPAVGRLWPSNDYDDDEEDGDVDDVDYWQIPEVGQS